MSVTRKSRSIVFTAQDDTAAGPFRLRRLSYVGASLTAGQTLTIVDPTSDSILAQHIVEDTIQNIEFNFMSHWVGGIKITAMPVSGGTVYAEIG
jgi:hypothetical protein